jgi:hypothetical protein
VAKAKGTIVVPTVRFLRTRREEARSRLPERLHPYLDETLQTGQWYPEEDFLELLRTMAAMMPGSGTGLYEQLGRAAAAEHLAGIYRHLRIEGSDALGLARRSFALWSTMHDTGRLRTVDGGSDGATFLLEDYAHPSREMCATVTGYFTEALRAAGLDAALRKTACVLDGASECAWRATWKSDGRAD